MQMTLPCAVADTHCDCACCTPEPGICIDCQYDRANSCCCYCLEAWPGFDDKVRVCTDIECQRIRGCK